MVCEDERDDVDLYYCVGEERLSTAVGKNVHLDMILGAGLLSNINILKHRHE